MLDIDKYLKGKTVIVGVGNMIKGDDQVGPRLIQRLRGKIKAGLFDCGEVPENYIRPIIESKPETIIVVDAAEWGGKIGELRIIKKEEINPSATLRVDGERSRTIKNFGFSTHNASLGIFVDYLKKELPLVNIIIIGIQVGRKGLMQPLSPEVEVTLNELVDSFMDIGNILV